MDFRFSQEQLDMAAVVRALLEKECKSADLRRLLVDESARDDGRWKKLSGLGLLGVLVPENAGGLGLSEVDLVLIAENCGYFGLPEPFVESAGIGAPLLATFYHDPRVAPWLPRILSGQAAVVTGHSVNPFIADADIADILALTHSGELHLVTRSQVTLIREPSVDPFRRLFRVDWTPSKQTTLADGTLTTRLQDIALDRGALFASAQCLGLAQRCVDMAVAYAQDRRQFGKAIGSYQAIKHQLASAQLKIEFARPVVYAAAAQISSHDLYSRGRISHAKLAATEAADFAARTAIQVHGAMGYSWEVDVHFFLKRALALSGAWGDMSFHGARLAQRIFSGALGPDQTFAQASAAYV